MKRVYHVRRESKFFFTAFFALSLFFFVTAWRGRSTEVSAWLSLAMAVILLFVGAWNMTQSLTSRLVLSEDSICLGDVFRKQSLRFNQISYRREYEECHDSPDGSIIVRYLEFVSREGRTPNIKIDKGDYDLDQEFWQWAIHVPELEQLED